MGLRDDLHLWTPRLRRYARALCSGTPGRTDLADDLVHAALLRVLKDDSAGRGDLGVRLYVSVTDLHRDHLRRLDVEHGRQNASGDYESGRGRIVPESWARTAAPAPEGLMAGLSAMKLGDREALLLVVLEQCGYARAARILKISRVELIMRLARARLVLGKALGLAGGDDRGTSRGHLRIVK